MYGMLCHNEVRQGVDLCDECESVAIIIPKVKEEEE